MLLLSKVFIVLVLAVLALKLYLGQRQIAAIKAHLRQVPPAFKSSVTLAEHVKAGSYNLTKLRFGRCSQITEAIMILAFTIGGGIQYINDLINLPNHPLSQGVCVILLYSIINAIINLPFNLYSTFSIEQKFGFNKTTLGLFISDLIKSLLIAIVVAVPLLYLILWLIGTSGNYWWILVWGVLVIFNLVMLIIYPTFIAPIFNKFKSLEDSELKTRINNLLIKCGFKSNGIFIMDGSKRSSHGNAYFTGIGKTKRIVFFDTLIKQLNPNEIEAVLAHELGHFKKKHIVKQIIISFVLTLVTLFVLSLIIHNPLFFNSLGVTTIANYNALILFMILSGVVLFPLAPISSFMSRKNEFEADTFAAEHSNKTWLINGLIKLYRDNASTLTPDALYVKFYYSHPPASLRIEHLEQFK